jgi:hypothetical protein
VSYTVKLTVKNWLIIITDKVVHLLNTEDEISTGQKHNKGANTINFKLNKLNHTCIPAYIKLQYPNKNSLDY